MTDRTFKILLVALAAMNAADYVLTLRAVYMLGCAEGNPLMAPVLGLGTAAFPLIKLLAVPLICLGIWTVRDKLGLAVREMVAGAVVVYSGLMVWHGVITAGAILVP